MKFEMINDDCLNVLKSLKDKSVNLCVTSPPYNMNLRVRNGKHCSRQLVKEITTKYVGFSDNLPMDEYFEFNKKVITELLRVSDLTFYNVQFLTGNKAALYRLIGEFAENIKEFIIWDKVTAQPAIGSNVLNSRFEVLLVFSDKDDAIIRQFKKCNFERGELDNLWQIKRSQTKCKEHGATFPLELIERIISTFSNEDDTVLDPFMGTGTTGFVCKRLNRNFIGVEFEKTYYEFAKKVAESGVDYYEYTPTSDALSYEDDWI